MTDQIKAASIVPELRVVLFVVFGVALWLFLVGGMSPANIGSANANEAGVEAVTSLNTEVSLD